jgi:hypothetical protein
MTEKPIITVKPFVNTITTKPSAITTKIALVITNTPSSTVKAPIKKV